MIDRHARDIRTCPCENLPELVLIGRTEIEKALPKLQITPHRDCMEIYFAYKGKKSLFALGQEYELKGGDFFLTPPGVEHSTGPMPVSKCAHYWLRLNLKYSRPFLNSVQYEPLRDALLDLPVQQGTATQACHEHVRRLYDLATETKFITPNGTSLLQINFQLTLGTLLFELLQTITAHHAPLSESQKETHPAVEDAITFMNRHLGENLSVTDFAAAAGYSMSAFQTLFKKDTGIAPKEYFIRMKLDWAKTLLADPQKNITQISHELGFSSSQYFSTAFKRYHLLSPGDFRSKPAQP